MLEANILDWEKRLMETGLVGNVYGGIQIDLNAVRRKLDDNTFTDAPLCDHNCTYTAGNYDCPAAITLNQGVIATSLAPSSKIVGGIKNTAEAIESSKEFFLGPFFDGYCEEFKIPYKVGETIRECLKRGGIEVNLFGANPEMHPELGKIIRSLKTYGYLINLTTTGKRFVINHDFRKEILSDPPHLIATSADDFESIEQIQRIANLSTEDIFNEWKKVPINYGQRQKTYESIYIAKLAQENPNFPKILFNVVVHTGNLPTIHEFLTTLHQNFPKVILNPIPAQSSFLYRPRLYDVQDITMFQSFIDKMMEIQISEEHELPIVPRLQYWLLLKSAIQTYSNPEKISEALSGYDVWKCYARPGAGRYVQIGVSPEISRDRSKTPGGHLGCFWNNYTVTNNDTQVWDMSKEAIEHYISGGIVDLANKSERPCPGCIMPRLVFDEISTETGMNRELRPRYLELRKQYVGY